MTTLLRLADPFISAFLEAVPPGTRRRVTYTDLLDELTSRVGNPPLDWPRHGKAMQGRLQRHADTLRAAGVQVRAVPEGHDKRVFLYIER